MNNTRQAPPTLHAMRYLRGNLLGDCIRGHSPPNRAYVEPSGGATSALVKEPRSHAEAHGDDTEIKMWLWRVATFLLADRPLAVHRSSCHTSSPSCLGLQFGLYAAAGVAVALLAWYPGHWLIALIFLPVIWSFTCSRWSALSIWVGYYLTGARDIPFVCARFFAGNGELSASTALALGVVFLLGQALVLAAPWALLTPRSPQAPRAARTVLAIMFVSLPPLGIIGWLSPVHVASALYPGWQLAGLLLGMCMLATAACIRRSRTALFGGVLLMNAAAVAHLVGHRPEVPFGWMAVDTSLGRLDQRDYVALFARTEATMQAARREFETGVRVVVLPEELVGLWRPAIGYWWRDYLQHLAASSRTLILGVDLVETGSLASGSIAVEPFLRYTDSAVVVGAGDGRFDSRQPVPAGLWRPWAKVSATPGRLTQRYLAIAGRRAAFSICYEDFLWWPHWRLLIDRPDVMVSMSNGWFSADLALAQIQQQSVQSIAQLAGVPLLRVVNR